jgi:hypothetical protein
LPLAAPETPECEPSTEVAGPFYDACFILEERPPINQKAICVKEDDQRVVVLKFFNQLTLLRLL